MSAVRALAGFGGFLVLAAPLAAQPVDSRPEARSVDSLAPRLAEHLSTGEQAPDGQGVGRHRELTRPDGSFEAVEAILIPRKQPLQGAIGLSSRFERIEAYRHRHYDVGHGLRRHETTTVLADLSGRPYRVLVVSKTGKGEDWVTTAETQLPLSDPAAVEAWNAIVKGLSAPASQAEPRQP